MDSTVIEEKGIIFETFNEEDVSVQTDYSIRRLTQEIRHYFEISTDVQEVLIYSGNREVSVKRNIALSKGFLKMMMNSFR